MPDNQVSTTDTCDKLDAKTLRRYKFGEVVLLASYSCALECKFHIHEVVEGPFDKALVKCPAAVQVEVVRVRNIDTD